MSKKLLVALSIFCASAHPVFAEELDAIFKKVNEYVAAKNYTKAIEELSWAQKELEKLNSGRLGAFFPDKLGAFQAGKFEANNALGLMNAEREYKDASGSVALKVSLTGGASAGGQSGLGGLAALGRMAAMMGGNQPGQETVRIAGRTAMLEKPEGANRAELTVFLDSGAILKLEQQTSSDTDALKKLAESLDLNSLDNYLKGQA